MEPNRDTRQGNSGAPSQNKPALQLARGTVARGRTVDVADTDKPAQIYGYTPDGKPMTRHPQKSIGPGNEIELPAEEIAHLRTAGYLIDPDRILPPIGDGPRYTEHQKAA